MRYIIHLNVVVESDDRETEREAVEEVAYNIQYAVGNLYKLVKSKVVKIEEK